MKTILVTYWFRSSNGATLYETLGYSDGSTSCNCPGWTRRVDAAGTRSCKHTRMVEGGLAADHCERSIVLGEVIVKAPAPKPVRKPVSTTAPTRAFNFEE